MQPRVTPSKPSTKSHFRCLKNFITERLFYRGVFKMVCGNKASWNSHCNFLFDVLLLPSASNAYLGTVSHWSDWKLHKSGGGRFMFVRKFFPASEKLFDSNACKYIMHETMWNSSGRSLSCAPFYDNRLKMEVNYEKENPEHNRKGSENRISHMKRRKTSFILNCRNSLKRRIFFWYSRVDWGHPKNDEWQ